VKENMLNMHMNLLHHMASDLPGGPEGWAPHRLIYRDWWNWRDHELYAAHGNLALIGQNEGGKSSLLALGRAMLDGDTSPRRLDPTQSPDRYLDYFLLGKEEHSPDDPSVFAYRARVGYIALEFYRRRDGAYITIGMGVDASRNVQGRIREWWGFIIPTRRLGIDFDVRNSHGLCMNLQEFRQHEALGKIVDGEGDVPLGSVVMTTKRQVYRQQVNRNLFKMTDDDFLALMETLVSAGRPKIVEASTLGPEKVFEALRGSLRSLPVELMDNLSAVITNLEKYQRNMKEIERHVSLLDELDQKHYAMVEGLVQKATQEYSSELGRYANLIGRLRQAERQKEEAIQKRVELGAHIATLKTRRATAEARLAAVQIDAGDLPEQLSRAEAVEAELLKQVQAAGSDIERIGGEIERHRARLTLLQDSFDRDRRQLVAALQAQANHMRQIGWKRGADIIDAGRSDVMSLHSSDTPDQAEAVRPETAYLLSEVRSHIKEINEIRKLLKAVEDASNILLRGEQHLENLRRERQSAVDAIGAAEERLEHERDWLLTAIEACVNVCPPDEVPDHVMASVRSAVSDLAAVPEAGSPALAEPLLQYLGGRMATARTSGHRSVYEWLRFRPGVSEETAALVEGALFESGLLDLAVEESAADAWIRSVAAATGTNLMSVLDVEEGAPSAVLDALCAIGWGDGQGEHWIAPDGRWRHGLAEGRVAPWLENFCGFIGTDRREQGLQRRIASLTRRRNEANEAVDAARVRASSHEEDRNTIGEVREQLMQLPPQSFYDALRVCDAARQKAAGAARAVEEAKPAVEAARQAYQAADAAYRGRVARFPMAAGKDEDDLSGLDQALRDLQVEVGSLVTHYEKLAGHLTGFADTRVEIRGREQDKANRKADHQRLSTDYTTAQARTQALRQRLADPDVAAAVGLKRELEAEIQEIVKTLGEGGEELRKQERAEDAADNQITLLTPEVEAVTAARDTKRAALVRVLSLHPDFEEDLARLTAEKEHQHRHLQSLPKLAEDADVDQVINQHRIELMRCFEKVLVELADYSPRRDTTYEEIDFADDNRTRLSPRDLYERLSASRDRTKELLHEEERKLYEDIICNSLLDDLIDLMHEADTFTEKLNQKLRKLTASSGAFFSFRLDLRKKSPALALVGN
jgi:hypothetical protein